MGDWFQVIVDRDATEPEAPRLGAAVHEWLAAEGIVSLEPADCVLGSALGYPPGPSYGRAVVDPDDGLFTLAHNGLRIVTGRTVFDPGQGGFELVCASCSNRSEVPDEWGEAVDEWCEARGRGLLACPRCGRSRPVTEWESDPPCVLAYLGFKFWNWPPLKEELVEEIGKRLAHRVVLVSGKL